MLLRRFLCVYRVSYDCVKTSTTGSDDVKRSFYQCSGSGGRSVERNPGFNLLTNTQVKTSLL